MSKDPRQVAVFGGTFDPPHLSHFKIAQKALDSGACDHVLWVPTFNPPHKQGNEISSYEHRFKMIELMLTEVNKINMSISNVERRPLIQMPNYIIETLELLSEDYENLSLLIGSDSLYDIDKWYRWQDLLENYKIIVHPRDLFSFRDLDWITPQIEGSLQLTILCGKRDQISSTKMKKYLYTEGRFEHPILTNNLHPNVVKYIKMNNLYKEN